jgi:hypothetical protein
METTVTIDNFDVVCEMAANHVAVFLNFIFWQRHDFSADGVMAVERDEILRKLASVWSKGSRSRIPLGLVET